MNLLEGKVVSPAAPRAVRTPLQQIVSPGKQQLVLFKVHCMCLSSVRAKYRNRCEVSFLSRALGRAALCWAGYSPTIFPGALSTVRCVCAGINGGTGAEEVLCCFVNEKDFTWRHETLFSIESSFKYALFP